MDIATMPATMQGEPCWRGVDNSLPPAGKPVFYRTAHYQMLGYQDKGGRWIGMDGKVEVMPVERWREVKAEPFS